MLKAVVQNKNLDAEVINSPLTGRDPIWIADHGSKPL
jgi:hypothetical protein